MTPVRTIISVDNIELALNLHEKDGEANIFMYVTHPPDPTYRMSEAEIRAVIENYEPLREMLLAKAISNLEKDRHMIAKLLPTEEMEIAEYIAEVTQPEEDKASLVDPNTAEVAAYHDPAAHPTYSPT